ncbi:hypothetical protein EMIT053CA3_40089 [Pseudomonas donghuensis]
MIMTGLTSTPMPSPSMNGMIGLSGTLREWSALTVILSPTAGTLIFWYPMLHSVFFGVVRHLDPLSVPQLNGNGNHVRKCPAMGQQRLHLWSKKAPATG